MYVHMRWGLSKPLVAAIHATLLAIVTASGFFLVPAAIFSALEEDWNFLESFYFCFISLSTIGLGDYVPGESHTQRFRELYKVGITSESGGLGVGVCHDNKNWCILFGYSVIHFFKVVFNVLTEELLI